MLAKIGNRLPGGRNEVRSPLLLSIHGHVANLNQFMERKFSKPFDIVSNVTDVIEKILSLLPSCCSYCLCLSITLATAATSIAVGVGVGVGVGCDK